MIREITVPFQHELVRFLLQERHIENFCDLNDLDASVDVDRRDQKLHTKVQDRLNLKIGPNLSEILKFHSDSD